jgi:hypothetical protein
MKEFYFDIRHVQLARPTGISSSISIFPVLFGRRSSDEIICIVSVETVEASLRCR